MQTDAALIRRHDSFDFSAAEERLASFALNLSVRLELRGLCGRNFALAMCRADIGNYLRLATGTVSRIFARFQRDRLLRVDRRQVEVVDMAGLREVAQSAIPFWP